MRPHVLLIILLGLIGTAVGMSDDDAKVIEAARQTSVHQIEDSLPDRPFDKWLRNLVGPQRRIAWEVNDCGEQTGNPEIDQGRNFPMCVSALVDLGADQRLDVELVVGSFKSGVGPGPASFHHAAVLIPNGPIKFYKSLGQLSEAITAVK
jgi:hypothetical protein